MRVLVVEEEPVIALDIQTTILDLGMRPLAASTVADAMEAIESRRFDVAFLDVKLRDGEIWTLIETLRTRGVPFALVTSGELGADHDPLGAPVLEKPFGKAELKQTLDLLAEQLDRRDYAAGLMKPETPHPPD